MSGDGQSVHERVERIDEAYAYCVDHDRWPEGFFPADAIRDLLEDVRGYRRSLMAHHALHNLSDAAIRESIGGPCQICDAAQRRRPA